MRETSNATADVGRLLVAQLVDQHRGEPVDRVGRDAHRGLEVLHRQREERPVRQRMAVQQQESGSLGHARSLGPPLRQIPGRRAGRRPAAGARRPARWPGERSGTPGQPVRRRRERGGAGQRAGQAGAAGPAGSARRIGSALASARRSPATGAIRRITCGAKPSRAKNRLASRVVGATATTTESTPSSSAYAGRGGHQRPPGAALAVGRRDQQVAHVHRRRVEQAARGVGGEDGRADDGAGLVHARPRRGAPGRPAPARTGPGTRPASCARPGGRAPARGRSCCRPTPPARPRRPTTPYAPAPGTGTLLPPPTTSRRPSSGGEDVPSTGGRALTLPGRRFPPAAAERTSTRRRIDADSRSSYSLRQPGHAE